MLSTGKARSSDGGDPSPSHGGTGTAEHEKDARRPQAPLPPPEPHPRLPHGLLRVYLPPSPASNIHVCSPRAPPVDHQPSHEEREPSQRSRPLVNATPCKRHRCRRAGAAAPSCRSVSLRATAASLEKRGPPAAGGRSER